MNDEPNQPPEKSSARDRAMASASPMTLARIKGLKAQLGATDRTRDQLLELCAAACVVNEELTAALEVEREGRRKESGAAPILHAFAASAGGDLNMLDAVEVALDELSPGNPTLLSLKAMLVSSQRDARSVTARKAAKTRHHEGDEAEARAIVKQCWCDWRANPEQHKNATKFAEAMLSKLPRGVTREPITITRWVREWDKKN